MRALSIAIVVAVAAAISLAAAGAGHASAAMLPLTHTLLQRASATQAVPPHEGSRVGVQVVVLGIAAGLVLVVGTAAYVIRRRLGLTAPPPGEPPASGH